MLGFAMVGASSGPPDSMTRTCAPEADNSAARTEPAAPAPTTMKSYCFFSFDALVILNPQDLISVGSPDLHAAVDDDVDTGHVRAFVGRQEQRHVRHFFRPTETTQERLAEHRCCPLRILQLLARLIGFDQPWRDRVGANPMLSPFHRELSRHGDHTRLRRRMGQGA